MARTKKVENEQSVSTTDEVAKTEEVKMKLTELHPFEGHPFKVLDDALMVQTIESIHNIGVVVPLIVRPDPDGGFEVISGHRRLRAAELAGLTEVPVTVKELTDDEAIIMMVDSNLHRENILPSERAFAYKMKLDAMKHQGQRTDLTSVQVAQKLETKTSREILGEQVGQSQDQVRRFIRLTNLIPEMLDKVDAKELAFNTAVELSYLTPEQQKDFMEAMDASQNIPSLSQAQRIKKLSQEGTCNFDTMLPIMDEEKKGDLDKVVFRNDVLRKYFPKSYTPQKMQETIIKLLEQWQRKRQRDMER